MHDEASPSPSRARRNRGDYLLLANSAAGSADRSSVGSALFELCQHASAVLRLTDGPGDVVPALEEHPDASVVVAGGDGTISSTVDSIISAGLGARPLGVVPSGTGNDFARAMGIPLDATAAARAVAMGGTRSLSALEVRLPDGTTRFGVNAIHLGLGAASSRRASGWKPTLGATAYPLAAAVTGSRWDPVEMTVSERGAAGNGAVLHRGPGAMVALVLGRSVGGGVELTDSDSFTDGRATLLVSAAESLRDRASLAAGILSGDPGRAAGVSTCEVTGIVVESAEPVAVNLDGEDLGDHDRVEVAVSPGSWTLLGAP